MILTLLFCMFGSIFAKSLSDINYDLTHVLEEFQKYEIEIPDGFEESIYKLNNLYEDIFEDKHLKGKSSQNKYNSFDLLIELIRLFVEKYSNIYDSFEEFFYKWQHNEISESIENESSNNENSSTELTSPEELLELYEGIIESMKFELYPALIYFDHFTNDIFEVINHKTLGINYEIFKNRVKFDMTPEGIDFKFNNNIYYKYFKEFNNSSEDIIKEYDIELEKSINTYIFNRTLLELKCILNKHENLKRDSNEELSRKFSDLLTKFDLLESCIERNESEIEPEIPNYYNGTTLFSIIILVMFLLLLF